MLLISTAAAQNNVININGVDLELPNKYTGGKLVDGEYKLNNTFSIKCIDNKLEKSIGLWATEKDFEENLTIEGHPVKHYCQYNEYVGGNHSHAYFASGDSVYEISWTGKEINTDIEKLIKNTPKSNIDEDTFYTLLDKAIDTYKQEKIDKLNSDVEYNYLETKINSKNYPDASDDTRFKEILLTYYNR